MIYVIELDVAFERNIDDNANKKNEIYRNLKYELSSNYHTVQSISP